MQNLGPNGLYSYGKKDYNMNILILIKKNMFSSLNHKTKDV